MAENRSRYPHMVREEGREEGVATEGMEGSEG